MAGLLGEIFGTADAAKRRLRDFMANPALGAQQALGNLNDRARNLNEMTAAAAREGVDYGPASQRLGGLLADAYNPMGIFIGPKAKTWNKSNAAKAEKMEKAGETPENIWMATGTFRGPDGKLRQEISDANSMPGQKLYSWGEGKDLEQGNSTVVRRQKALLHPALSAAYPDTKNIGVLLKSGREGGFYNIDMDNIGAPISGRNQAADRSIMLHELQHAVQQREGFAMGGSPNRPYSKGERDFLIQQNIAQRLAPKDKANPYAASAYTETPAEALGAATKYVDSEAGRFDAYRRLLGEAEARAVQARRDMTQQQRLATFPYQSYDMPINQLIVPGLLD